MVGALINVIKIILLKLFSMLPDSPFQIAFAEMDTDFIPALNWFLPLDICANITLAWVACMLAFYVFMLIKGLVVSFIKSKIIKAVIAAFLA